MDRLTDVFGSDKVSELKCLCEYGSDGDILDISPCSDYCKNISQHTHYTNCDECGIQRAIEKLAAYEDTGLTPAEITAMKIELSRLKYT